MEAELRQGGAEPGLRLIETLAWDGAGALREERHLRRMARSARALGWGWDEGAAQGAARLRLSSGPSPSLKLSLA